MAMKSRANGVRHAKNDDSSAKGKVKGIDLLRAESMDMKDGKGYVREELGDDIIKNGQATGGRYLKGFGVTENSRKHPENFQDHYRLREFKFDSDKEKLIMLSDIKLSPKQAVRTAVSIGEFSTPEERAEIIAELRKIDR